MKGGDLMKTSPSLNKIFHGPLEPLFSFLYITFVKVQFLFFKIKWAVTDAPKATDEDAKNVADNVTFIYKSFERQSMAKRLYRNIQKMYPGAKVVIADDSKKPLKISGDNVEIIHLPFNSGLSKGLNLALSKVKTPFTMRLDDDELLTPYSRIHEHLRFLQNHPEVDLIGILPYNAPFVKNPLTQTKFYFNESMSSAPIKLKIPHMTTIDENYVVLGKVPNIFLARTKEYRAVGYDDNIRMIDHQEFFFRAAGKITSALSLNSYVFHYHDRFNKYYDKFRADTYSDGVYIKSKYPEYFK